MSILSTIFTFVLVPLAIIGVIAALALGGGSAKSRSRRYRPGRPYNFQPIWFLAAPEQITPALGGPEATRKPALEAGVIEDSAGVRVLPGSTGGASDRW